MKRRKKRRKKHQKKRIYTENQPHRKKIWIWPYPVMHWQELPLLKLSIYKDIWREKVSVLIDSSGTHNFIHFKIAKELNCFMYPAPEYQVMVANGGTINCSGKYHNINRTMGEYVLNSPMISIPMGGVDVVLRVQCL